MIDVDRFCTDVKAACRVSTLGAVESQAQTAFNILRAGVGDTLTNGTDNDKLAVRQLLLDAQACLRRMDPDLIQIQISESDFKGLLSRLHNQIKELLQS